jgi:hypothetical protein
VALAKALTGPRLRKLRRAHQLLIIELPIDAHFRGSVRYES